MQLTQPKGTPRQKREALHVDEFIDYGRDCGTSKDADEIYARWVLLHFRLSASLKLAFAPLMKDHPLFCTYGGKRYRVIGASRMGDIWLVEDFTKDNGYDLRVDVMKCSGWSAKPEKS